MAWDITSEWGRRPWWMNLIWFFCLFMTFFYMPFDVFYKPVALDEEVWFGVTLHGWAAKLTAPLHWLIYGAGAYGFWKMRPWIWPWAAIYCAQVAIAMLVWNLLDPRGSGWLAGLIAAAIFIVPVVALWRSRDRFRGVSTQTP
ncbi:MAG: hypothetical protein HC809_16425 [Gammaproteobacteria bacterium]|nr:hypothetical protein [Gammaproteobacteria bacterium]